MEDEKNPTLEKPIRVLILSGSNRRQFDCPGIDSKSRAMMLRLADLLPTGWEIDVEDLGNVYQRPRIQPCNACVSTSMALCCWPCNCYEAGNSAEPDLMWDLDLYARLDLADAWVILGPVNWYAPSSNLKLMFDRLVCMSGGNPREGLIQHKDPELAIALEKSEAWKDLSQNHLEGRTAAFFCYGDGGGDELDEEGRPKLLRHAQYFDPKQEPFQHMRDTYAPLVWQCRYAGVEVPDSLWRYIEFGQGKKYSENQAEHMEPNTWSELEAFAQELASFVARKGKVEPGTYRAYGYIPPSHRLADLRAKWRGLRIALGYPPQNSSPQKQQELGLNRDATLRFRRSEAHRFQRKK